MAEHRISYGEIIERLTQPRDATRPHVALKRSVAKGAVEIDVKVPVCDEYPTLEQARAATVELFDGLLERYPMPNGGAS